MPTLSQRIELILRKYIGLPGWCCIRGRREEGIKKSEMHDSSVYDDAYEWGYIFFWLFPRCLVISYSPSHRLLEGGEVDKTVDKTRSTRPFLLEPIGPSPPIEPSLCLSSLPPSNHSPQRLPSLPRLRFVPFILSSHFPISDITFFSSFTGLSPLQIGIHRETMTLAPLRTFILPLFYFVFSPSNLQPSATSSFSPIHRIVMWRWPLDLNASNS